MKKVIAAVLLSAFALTATPAVAEPGQTLRSIGGNYGIDHVLGIQAEFDISPITDYESLTGQVFLKNYSQGTSRGASWDATAIGVAAIYDFNAAAKSDRDIHPYAGIGLTDISYRWTGAGPKRTYAGAVDWVYLVAGVKYTLAPQLDADLNYNTIGDLTFGMNYSF